MEEGGGVRFFRGGGRVGGEREGGERREEWVGK